MTTAVPAIEGWFTTDGPALVGSRCGSCSTTFFPPAAFCRNPRCVSGSLEPVSLSRTGRVWSYTTNHYEAPPPSVVKPPYSIAAVSLEAERMVVLGLVDGEVSIGDEVEIVIGQLDEEHT